MFAEVALSLVLAAQSPEWIDVTPASSGSLNHVAVHSLFPERVLLFSDVGLHASTDGGKTWKRTASTRGFSRVQDGSATR
jgi:hypothetical protein